MRTLEMVLDLFRLIKGPNYRSVQMIYWCHGISFTRRNAEPQQDKNILFHAEWYYY